MHPRVFAYIAYRVGAASDAEDITAEVFMRVVNGLDRFEYRGEGAFAALLNDDTKPAPGWLDALLRAAEPPDGRAHRRNNIVVDRSRSQSRTCSGAPTTSAWTAFVACVWLFAHASDVRPAKAETPVATLRIGRRPWTWSPFGP